VLAALGTGGRQQGHGATRKGAPEARVGTDGIQPCKGIEPSTPRGQQLAPRSSSSQRIVCFHSTLIFRMASTAMTTTLSALRQCKYCRWSYSQ
jgi:hypothetical protein